MTPALVEVREVNRSFALSGVEVHAVRNVTLGVGEGEFVALRGRSGSGKTTLLNLIAGLDRPDSGSVHLAGEEISSANEARLTDLRRHSIGFVVPVVRPAAAVLGARERRAGAPHRRRAWACRLGAGARGHRPRGARAARRSSPVRAVGRRAAARRDRARDRERPPLLIADEPTGELDSATGAQIFELLQSISAEGTTVIAATHDPLMIEHVGRIFEMADGELVGETAAEAAPADWGSPGPRSG